MDKSVSGLPQEQIDEYWTNGYLSGIQILSSEQMEIARKKLIQLEHSELESDPNQWSSPDYLPWSDRKNSWWHWIKPMATHPKIIAAVRGILGQNILIRNADVFVKPAQSARSINWHVDCTADIYEADKMLSVWFAISNSEPENGCMEFLPGSHRMPLPPNIKDKTTLSFAGTALERANSSARESNIIQAGQISMHHFRTVHRSSGNTTSQPRIGLVIRFMSSDASVETAETGKAFLACGENLPGHFSIQKNFPVTWKRSPNGDLQSSAKGESID